LSRLDDLARGPEHTLLAFLKDPVVVVGKRGAVAYLNPSFRNEFDVTRETSVGKALDEILPPWLARPILERLERLAPAESSRAFWLGERNQRLKISMTGVSQNGKVVGAVITLWDAKPEISTKQKNLDLFRAMLDDIRLPVDKIKSITSVTGSADPSSIAGAAQQTEQLLESLARFRDFGEVLFGQVRTEQVSFKPNRLVALARKSLRPVAEHRGVFLEDGSSRELPDLIGDPALLNRILGLLVDYMIKVTPKGEMVVVAADLPEMGGAQSRLFYSITGTGVDNLSVDFGEGEHALAAGLSGMTDEQKRLALRLLLARRLVSTLEGEFTVAAHEHTGATISICAPVRVAAG